MCTAPMGRDGVAQSAEFSLVIRIYDFMYKFTSICEAWHLVVSEGEWAEQAMREIQTVMPLKCYSEAKV